MNNPSSDAVHVIDQEQYKKLDFSGEMPVAVLFDSNDNIPCKALLPAYERVASKYRDRMRFYRIDRQQNRPLADELEIHSCPTLLFLQDGKEACARLSGYIEATDLLEAMERVLGKACEADPKHLVVCDVLILGAGPAGMTAAIYAARSKLFTVVIDTSVPGGQVATTFNIANYPGTDGAVSGTDLMENMKNQALAFGAVLHDMQKIQRIVLEGKVKQLETANYLYRTRSILIATGAEPRKLPVENEKEYRSRGIHYCATCDGAMYQDTEVLVVGGGVSALEEAEFLTRFARHVTIINRGEKFRASQGMVDHVLRSGRITVKYRTIIEAIKGDVFVTSAMLKNVDTNEIEEMEAEGIFVYIGSQPDTSLFGDKLETSPEGFILAGEDMKTNLDGVFVAGDIRNKSIRQITTAVSDGTVAAIMAERYLAG